SVGDQHAAGVLGYIDVIENPHALERQGGKAGEQLTVAEQFVFVVGQCQIDHRSLALEAALEELARGLRNWQFAIELTVLDKHWCQQLQVLRGGLDNAHGGPRLRWREGIDAAVVVPMFMPMLPKADGKRNPNKRLIYQSACAGVRACLRRTLRPWCRRSPGGQPVLTCGPF